MNQVLDPRYPCHSEIRVLFNEDEQRLDTPYPRACPACGKEWLVERRMFAENPTGRVDTLIWLPVTKEPVGA